MKTELGRQAIMNGKNVRIWKEENKEKNAIWSRLQTGTYSIQV
jgi:hypothetical protein